MKVRPVHTCLISLCVVICYTSALEASIKEPSCDELRAMWRFSKRQSRAAEMTNEIPTYRDPFALNVWEEYARPRSAGRGGRYKKPPVYGTVVGNSRTRTGPAGSPQERRQETFEQVIRMIGSSWPPVAGAAEPARGGTSFRYGGGRNSHSHPTQTGSFQHLKALIRNERARELQEQRLQEEEQSKIQYPSPRLTNDAPPTGIDRQLARDKPNPQGKGVVAFPDILLPSLKYLEDYMGVPPQGQKYRNKLPDTNTLIGGDNPWAW